ncbi:MAG: helix-turn-helix transcriptional regulator [Actinomycetota bacterium]|nr:helix-turn-helix transcriptional regulator [Actinomycetota bacterium]
MAIRQSDAPQFRTPLAPFCPRYHAAVELLGRRWTGAVVRSLLAGRHRFGEMRADVSGISDRLLSERLRELETEGIIERRIVAGRPVRNEYYLTTKGESLGDVVRAISSWAEEWTPPGPTESP